MESHIAAPPRRPGALAVHSLDRFVFSVPDLREAMSFYQAFGLDVRDTEGRLDLGPWQQVQKAGCVPARRLTPGSRHLDTRFGRPASAGLRRSLRSAPCALRSAEHSRTGHRARAQGARANPSLASAVE